MKKKVNTYAYENKLTCFKSNAIDINLKNIKSGIRQDLLLEEKHVSKIWGYVLDDNNIPVKGASVTLLKVEYINKRQEYIKVDSTTSDANGLYQFEITDTYNEIEYMVNIDRR